MYLFKVFCTLKSKFSSLLLVKLLNNSPEHIQHPQSVCSLTVSGFLSSEWVAVFMIVGGDHRNLVERLRTQTVQHGVGHVSWHRFISSLLWEQRLPSKPVHLYIPGGRRPGHCEAAVGHIAGDQVFRWSHRWKQQGKGQIVMGFCTLHKKIYCLQK